jgi:hypothetical protein
MNKKRARDADGKLIKVLKPIYYYVGNFSGNRILLFENAVVQYEPELENAKIYGADKWHCFVNDEKGNYITQCRAYELTTEKETAIKLARNAFNLVKSWCKTSIKEYQDAIKYKRNEIDDFNSQLKQIVKKLRSK